MKRVVYVPGVWDMLHIGHLNIMKRAKLFGDYLVVAVCSDRLVEETKENPPIIDQHSRAEMIRALKIVDEVFIYDDLDQSYALEMFKVKTFCVGEEFGYLPEHNKAINYCVSNSIDVEKIKRYPGISSTDIRNRVNGNADKSMAAKFERRNHEALEIIDNHGQPEYRDEMVWVMDQVVRKLTENGYGSFIKKYEYEEDNPEEKTDTWETGTQPE